MLVTSPTRDGWVVNTLFERIWAHIVFGTLTDKAFFPGQQLQREDWRLVERLCV
jgi:hypothetical protein